MKLKSFKTIQIMYVVVSATALITACHTKVTEPLKIMSGQGAGMNQTVVSSDNATVVENYGVPQAQNVLFGSNAQDGAQDLTY
jgi:hypothetical protein